ncbi:MAG TPA: TonB-dependent receptor [Rhizomicrobium sp.]|nr:TonB-dependent receptor [Rhizomicrobium sp.]HJT42359.1 TonB-dependent receptor [Rhizomicrobium sp.]
MNNLVQKLMLGCSSAAIFTALAVSAQAQQPADNVESVVVSGSRISIGGFEAPTPVTVVDTEKLQSNAYGHIADSIRQLPQVNSNPTSFGASQGSANTGNAGANLLNLRNLGNNRTLILFDGQRIVNSNLTGGVDTTTLPSAIISRVDVVTGGASAAWGSDAVAGVVNFVIDKNFVGFKGKVQGGETTSGLVRSISADAVWGSNFFGDRGHLEVAASYNKRPDTVLLIEQKWYRGTFLVSNPNPGAGTSNANPQFVLADHVGLANSTMGGLITSSPAGGTSVPLASRAPANALRGIRFVENGRVEQVTFGNITAGVLSNGGSLTDRDSEAPWQTIGGPNTTYTLFAHGSYKLTDTIKASVQLNYGYFTGKGDAQSLQQTGSALVIKADNAFLPAQVRDAMVAGGIASFNLGTLNANNFNNYTSTGETYTRQAANALAPATTLNRRQIMRGVFTLEGSLGEDWLWNSYISHSQTRFSVRTLGIAIRANVKAAQDAVLVTPANRGTSGLALGSIVCRSTLTGTPVTDGVGTATVTASPGCVPLNVFGEGVASAAAIRYATGNVPGNNEQSFQNMTLNMDVFEASMQGKLPWALPAGDIHVAFGFHYRKEAGKTVASTIGDRAGYAVGNYTNFPSSNVNVREGFLEVDVPILKDTFVQSLDFNAAGRITDYSTSGLVETWKLGFTSQLIEDIKLRSVWSVDIRAPTINDLFGTAVSTGNCRDPKTGITGNCVRNLLPNPTLAPETARTISGGIVLTPRWIPGFTFSLDWYNVNLTGQINTIDFNAILDACTKNINNPLCAAYVFGGPGGALNIINRQPLNLNSLRTSGMDIQASYATELWDNDTLTLSFNANYVDEITLDAPDVPVNNYAGVLGAGGPSNASGASKWRGLLSANYKTGPYSFTTQVRWFGSAILNNFWNTGNRATAADRFVVSDDVFNVDPTAYLDLRASYDFNDNWQFFAAVDNLLNIPPQMVPSYNGAVQNNGGPTHSVTQYDYLGREVRLGVRFNF